MRIGRILMLGPALVLAGATAIQAQQSPPKKAAAPPAAAAKTATQQPTAKKAMVSDKPPALREAKPGLEAKATVKVDAATETAMGQVPNGHLLSRRITQSGGDLVYVFRIRGADQKSHEVWVNAMTGAVVPAPKPTPKPAGGKAKTGGSR